MHNVVFFLTVCAVNSFYNSIPVFTKVYGRIDIMREVEIITQADLSSSLVFISKR